MERGEKASPAHTKSGRRDGTGARGAERIIEFCHRIIEWLRLEGKLRIIHFQPNPTHVLP